MQCSTPVGALDAGAVDMTIQEIFAANLRRLVEARGSINRAARQLGIHRQQFARYLRAETIPQKHIRERMCSYFGVTDEELFKPPDADRSQEFGPECSELLRHLIASPPPLREGFYRTLFWAPILENTVVGALTVIRKKDTALTFRRLTASKERKGSRWSYVQGDHKGIVTERLGYIFFQGSNLIEPSEPTLITMKWAPLSQQMLSGHGMVISHLGPLIVNTVMEPMPPDSSFIRAFSQARIYDLSDPELGIATTFLKISPIH